MRKFFAVQVLLYLSIFLISTGSYAQETLRTTDEQLQKGNIVLVVTAAPFQDTYVLHFRVSGSGFPPQDVSASQGRLLAARAARVDAYRQLLIANKALTGEEIGRKIEGYVQQAEVKETSYESDGKARVIIEQPIYDGRKIGGRTLRTAEKKLTQSGIFWSKVLE